MTEREAYDPADESETPAPPVPDDVPAEVPEADAIEQAAPLGGAPSEPPDAVGDAPEADALEQQAEVADPDDDYRG